MNEYICSVTSIKNIFYCYSLRAVINLFTIFLHIVTYCNALYAVQYLSEVITYARTVRTYLISSSLYGTHADIIPIGQGKEGIGMAIMVVMRV